MPRRVRLHKHVCDIMI